MYLVMHPSKGKTFGTLCGDHVVKTSIIFTEKKNRTVTRYKEAGARIQ